jgi:hypothetical protein
MADLQISGEFLESLRGKFTALAAVISSEGEVTLDHSACGSEEVASAGNSLTTLQASRASISSGNATALATHVGTTSAEIAALEASLARSAAEL